LSLEAGWTMQTYIPSASSDEYHWWMRISHTDEKMMVYQKNVGYELRHRGVDNLGFMTTMSRALSSRTYFEIGTSTGNSSKAVRCDAVCVGPHFQITQSAFEGRRRAHFFQTNSDDFFDYQDLKVYFPGGMDHGPGIPRWLHHFEALFRDFANTERYCNSRSIALFA
jgi:hypothetical protein